MLAFATGTRLQHPRTAIGLTMGMVVLPYVFAVTPILPDEAARWLLRLTPAAGFGFQQTSRQYRQVIAHYAPSAGYFPLPWAASLAVLLIYTVAAVAVSARRTQRNVPLGRR